MRRHCSGRARGCWARSRGYEKDHWRIVTYLKAVEEHCKCNARTRAKHLTASAVPSLVVLLHNCIVSQGFVLTPFQAVYSGRGPI